MKIVFGAHLKVFQKGTFDFQDCYFWKLYLDIPYILKHITFSNTLFMKQAIELNYGGD